MPSARSTPARRRKSHAARPVTITNIPASVATIVNVHAAKTQLSRLLARVERSERITIARAGKPVAVIGPPSGAARKRLPLDDPLLRLDEYGFDGPVGKLTDEDIMRELGLTEALTTDRHFVEAGFKALLPLA